ATNGAAPEVHQMPVGRKAIRARILAHRRNCNPIWKRNAAQRQWRKELSHPCPKPPLLSAIHARDTNSAPADPPPHAQTPSPVRLPGIHRIRPAARNAQSADASARAEDTDRASEYPRNAPADPASPEVLLHEAPPAPTSAPT